MWTSWTSTRAGRGVSLRTLTPTRRLDMATIKSPAYLSNPHCQVYDQFIDRMAMEWQNTRLADQPKRRRAHQDAIAAVIDKRDERLADDGLLVVEHWGQGEDNNYYVFALAPVFDDQQAIIS